MCCGMNGVSDQRPSIPDSFMQAVRNRLWRRMELRCYAYRFASFESPPRQSFLRRDCMEDLHRYVRHESDQMTREDFLVESRRRRALGNHLYSLVHDGTLLYYGWLVDRQDRSEDPMMGHVFFPPANASVIFDCFTHPSVRGQGLYYRALCQMINDAKESTQAGAVCLGVFSDNLPSLHVINKLGFCYLGSLIKEQRLGTTRRYATAADPAFCSALL